jgi:hypothetical protein
MTLYTLIIIEDTTGMPHLNTQEFTLLLYYCNFCAVREIFYFSDVVYFFSAKEFLTSSMQISKDTTT